MNLLALGSQNRTHLSNNNIIYWPDIAFSIVSKKGFYGQTSHPRIGVGNVQNVFIASCNRNFNSIIKTTQIINMTLTVRRTGMWQRHRYKLKMIPNLE